MDNQNYQSPNPTSPSTPSQPTQPQQPPVTQSTPPQQTASLQTNQPPTSPPTSPKTKRLPLMLIGFVLAATLIAFLAGGFFLGANSKKQPEASPTQTVQKVQEPTPTPDPTANWKVYNSSTGNFSIKYPSDYKINIEERVYVDGVKTTTPNTIQIVSSAFLVKNNTEETNFILDISYKQIDQSTSLVDAIEKENPKLAIENSKFYKIDSEHALLFEEGSMGAYGPITQMYALHKGYLYSFTIESRYNYQYIEQQVNTLLSTLNFTDNNASIPTAPSDTVH